MLGMGLSLVPNDFKRISRAIQAVLRGTFCQMWCCRCWVRWIARSFPCRPTLLLADCGWRCVRASFIKSDHLPGQAMWPCRDPHASIAVINSFYHSRFDQIWHSKSFLEDGPPSPAIGSTMLQIVLITLLPIADLHGHFGAFPQAARRLEKP